MHVNHGYVPHPAARYHALAIVLVVHLALGWWLLRGAAPLEQPMRRSPLTPVLIQDVMIASPSPSPSPTPSPTPTPTPALTSQAQPPTRPPEAVVRRPVTEAPARSSPRPEPAPRHVASAASEVRPDATVMPANAQTPPTPMVSRVSPSVEPASTPAPVAATASVAIAGQPAASSVAVSSAAPAVVTSVSGLGRPGTPAPSQAQAIVAPGSASGASAVPADIAFVCPTQVAPVIPLFAKRGGISGVVEAQAVIVNGVVREVRILSGPSIFHNAVRVAMRQYRCVSKPTEVQVTQVFNFQVN